MSINCTLSHLDTGLEILVVLLDSNTVLESDCCNLNGAVVIEARCLSVQSVEVCLLLFLQPLLPLLKVLPLSLLLFDLYC